MRFNIETQISAQSAPISRTSLPRLLRQPIADLVRAHGLVERVSVQSFDWRTLGRPLAEIAPEDRTRLPHRARGRFDTLQGRPAGRLALAWGAGCRRVSRAGAPVRSPPMPDASPGPRHLTRTSERGGRWRPRGRPGLKVIPWTATRAPTCGRLIGMERRRHHQPSYPNRLRAPFVGERRRATAPAGAHPSAPEGAAGPCRRNWPFTGRSPYALCDHYRMRHAPQGAHANGDDRAATAPTI